VTVRGDDSLRISPKLTPDHANNMKRINDLQAVTAHSATGRECQKISIANFSC
jgi:hypothetical protein